MEFDNYFCVFYEDDDPAISNPVAIFDRMVFVRDFIRALEGKVKFRDVDGESFLTVAEWCELRQNST